MSILFGHPSGNPNSHQAALAHLESGRLEAFCVPWLPSAFTARMLRLAPAGSSLRRAARRHASALADAPTVQGRPGEWRRMIIRGLGRGDEGLSYEANDWLMDTMKRECRRPAVTAVHSYEDCSLGQFEEAKSAGKACIYDMPIGYYPAWQKTQQRLAQENADWLPEGGMAESRYVRVDQKRREMELADLVLGPSRFVEDTVLAAYPDKPFKRAPYGVDADYWSPAVGKTRDGTLRFVFAGQISLRKGVPLLLAAWKAAALPDAQLRLVGSWQLAQRQRAALPPGVVSLPPCGSHELRERYRESDVFVLPSYFEGMPLALLEAMACGLPAIASHAAGGSEVLDDSCGRPIATGDLDALVDAMRWASSRRESLDALGRGARSKAEGYTWGRYRESVRSAVESFL